ncbi:hypothetical protein BDK89_0210 [Ilumatobacter fluminis]|uniref:DUF6916 domain-containing protein n=1 Tax=Ilumatobacter fluminis TaxID=467091 RepID=A0A4R7HV34_9ACTN|nr:hypothetical protein [Ilumatobacter fluminis]TDT14655.1 hypothetical protein BDK89_0210 [Ilumatobacter fluminis]
MNRTIAPAVGRRELLIGGVAAAAAATVAGPGLGLIPNPLGSGTSDVFDRAALTEHIGETFRITAGPLAGATLQLVEVLDLPAGMVDPARQFVARFSSDATDLPAATYDLRSGAFGRIPLFVTPAGGAVGRSLYEVMVNRWTPVDEGSTP